MNDNIKGKKLLIMGGMQISCEIISKAKSMGIYTIVADYLPVEQSPGKLIADQHFDTNLTDVDAVVALIEREKIDGVFVGFNDMLLPYYAEICERTGLPCYGTKEQFETLIDKAKYKALCREFDVPSIPEFQLDSPDIQYPVLVKPVDSSGSRGLAICNSREELDSNLSFARGASKQGKVLIERYMTGQEVTIFWVFQDGNYYLSAMGNRHVKNSQGAGVLPLPVGYTFPSVYLPKYQAEVEEKSKAMFRHLGIQNGMLFMQCKVEDGTCYVYDIGFRLTGSLEYKIIEEVCGYNPMEMMITFALTGKMGNQDISAMANPRFGRPAFNVSCLCAPGTIAGIEGIEAVMRYPEVIDAVIAHYPGETITEQMRGLLAQITLRILGVAGSQECLYDVLERVYQEVRIVCQDGANHLLPGLERKEIEGLLLYC